MLTKCRTASLTLALLALLGCEAATNPTGIYGKFYTEKAWLSGPYDEFESDLALAIEAPAETILIVYNHGTVQSGIRQRCVPDSMPRYYRDAADERINGLSVVVYYLCSRETGAGSRGGFANSTIIKRSSEVGRTLERFIDHGVRPSRIVVAGHSGGASAALVAGARYGDRMAGVIATAPGYGYAYLGEEALSRPDTRAIRDNWQRTIKRGLDVPALVYAFAGDEIAPASDLEFLRDLRSVDFRYVGGAPPYTYCHPHLIPFDCFSLQYGRLDDFISRTVK